MRVATILTTCWLAAACSNAMTRRAPEPSNAEVEASVLIARVNHGLRAADIDGYAGLRITAVGSTVTIEGELATSGLRDRVAEAAQGVQGVEVVICQIATEDEGRDTRAGS